MKGRMLFQLSLLIIVGLLIANVSFAATEFTCNVIAVNSKGNTPNVNGATCTALAIYVNEDTEEEQKAIRKCKIVGNASSCTSTFDDSDINIALPYSVGINNMTSLEAMSSSLSTRGCIGSSITRSVGTDTGSSIFKVIVNYELVCP